MSVAIRYDMFCQMAYQPLPQRKQRILQQIQKNESFYIIVKEKQPWTFRDIFPVFLEELSAKIKAADMHLFDKGYEVQMIDADALQTLIQQQENISVVRIYDRLPFYQDYPLHPKQPEIPKTPLSINSEQKGASTESKDPQTLPAIKNLISMLDAQDRSAISKLPTYSFFEKFPQLLQKLVQVTGVDLQELDSIVGVDGLTAMTMKTPTADVSKDVLQKYLNYFGLGAYLYRYRDHCSELRQELNRHPEICKYKIVPAKVSTQEPFELVEMKRAKDDNGAYLYQLKFKSKDREQTCIDISPLGMIIGKKYELEGLQPLSENTNRSIPNNSLPSEKPAVSTKDKKVNLLADSKEQQKLLESLKQKDSDCTEVYLKTRKDYVLRYLKLQNPTGREIQIKEAEKYYTQLSANEDILDEFFWKICFPQKAKDLLSDNQEYQKRKDNQPKDLVIKDYTAEKLRKEFHLKYGWETYFFFAELKNHPKKTMEQLKYRKTDPQYQKNNKNQKDSE